MNALSDLALLQVVGVSVHVRAKTATAADAPTLLHPVSLSLRAGRAVTLLGETGSGKSLLAQALTGTLPPDLEAQGRVWFAETDLLTAPPAQRRKMWGRRIAVLPQEPWLALDPTMKAGAQVMETYWLTGGLSRRGAWETARDALAAVDVAEAEDRLPSQLSGGMAQRVAFAAAHTGQAQVLIADEPTKGLDADRRDGLTALLRQHVDAGGALLTITHDPDVARALGGDVLILRDGQIVEQGAADRVLRQPVSAFGKALLAADPAQWLRRRQGSPPGEAVLRAENVSLSRGGRPLFTDLSLEVRAGEVIGLSGPSGCGKSSFGDLCLGLLQQDAGTVWRVPGSPRVQWQKLYQDPPAAFPPRVRLRTALTDVIRRHQVDPVAIPLLMARLGLEDPLLDRLPADVSGGELQRLALLRVLLLRPIFLFADEPTSRLDLLTQQETIGLLTDLARDQGCGVLLVSHDRLLLDRVCDRVVSL